ncbi:SCP-like extracellular protein [Picosynechococcus sp. PCC 7003]|uniref:CAP domain-containing protein n=1 Tax=Picosynechococcus sp. PCC 7003 TaxID=374981 RepID=UPI00081083FE|nr:CAP domain-containing protein [Picosynechococcus sp. PCC 7003]ANV84166.1 SCP-like extracellular protein [Picosynechococcus sp. PCC 7003]
MRHQRWSRFVVPILFYFGARFVFEQTERPTISPTANQPVVQQEQPLTSQPVKLPNTETIEQQIHAQINAYRISLGLEPLTLDYRITNESRKYSAKMASGEASFSHDGFEDRAASLEKQALKYASVAENLALLQGYDDLATVAVEGWIDSPGHHKNIIGDFDLTGIGVVKNEEGVYYFTQLFLKRR